jgi:type I restriction enzyme S subunit
MFRAYLEQPVLIPERREQTRICDLIQLVSNEIELLEQQRAAFAAQRRGLMEKLLSGEIDIQNPKETAA